MNNNNMDLLDLLGGIGDPSPVLATDNSLGNIMDGLGGGIDSSLFGGAKPTSLATPTDGFSFLNNNSLLSGTNMAATTTTNHSALIPGFLDDLTSTGEGSIIAEVSWNFVHHF